MDPNGAFVKELNEHFFLTDPEELKFSHFPYDEVRGKEGSLGALAVHLYNNNYYFGINF